ncbi:hypothetical protein [Halorubellus sp. JP-L1]|uniref:hypothetical protein n=1 Tax=Halorubellus sp. JP-L1 TaxID=2715753 RepID=UPI001F03588C|nr:hypothetical protein [Halorubellus sp. JP-L1]
MSGHPSWRPRHHSNSALSVHEDSVDSEPVPIVESVLVDDPDGVADPDGVDDPDVPAALAPAGPAPVAELAVARRFDVPPFDDELDVDDDRRVRFEDPLPEASDDEDLRDDRRFDEDEELPDDRRFDDELDEPDDPDELEELDELVEEREAELVDRDVDDPEPVVAPPLAVVDRLPLLARASSSVRHALGSGMPDVRFAT